MPVDLARLLATPLPKVPGRRTQIELSSALQDAIDEGARTGSLEGVTALLDEGADPNRHPTTEGPLMQAMGLQWWAGARCLHARGARLPASLPGRTIPADVQALALAMASRDPVHLDWVHREVNGGQLGPVWPGGKSLSIVLGSAISCSPPEMLGFFMDHHGPTLDLMLWYQALVVHVNTHGTAEENLVRRFRPLGALGKEAQRIVWCHAVCSERPRETIHTLARLLPVHLLEGPGKAPIPMALHAARCNKPATFSWLMQDPALRQHFHAHLQRHPEGLEQLFCFQGKVDPSLITTNHPLHLMGVALWEALDRENLLPDASIMDQWTSGKGFCLHNLVTSGLLAPDIIRWVAHHWPDALTHPWPDAPTVLDAMAIAHREGHLPFDGRALAEQVLLEKGVGAASPSHAFPKSRL